MIKTILKNDGGKVRIMDNSIRVVEGEKSARFEFESKDEVDKLIKELVILSRSW